MLLYVWLVPSTVWVTGRFVEIRSVEVRFPVLHFLTSIGCQDSRVLMKGGVVSCDKLKTSGNSSRSSFQIVNKYFSDSMETNETPVRGG
jgi:hypothetical protein